MNESPSPRPSWWVLIKKGQFAFAILGLLMTAANISSGFLAYGFQIVLGNLLTRPEYLIFSSVMGLAAFASSPLNALYTYISRRVLLIFISKGYEAVLDFYRTILVKSFWASALGFVLWVPFTLYPNILLNGGTSSMVAMLYLIVVGSLFFSVNNGFLQGVKNFRWLGAVGPLGVIFKIFLALGLVWIGFGIDGALLGMSIALFLTFLCGVKVITNYRSSPAALVDDPERDLRKISYISILLANVAFVGATQLDVVIANKLLPQHEAELYAATAVLGKAVLYIPTGIVLVLFPLMLEREAKQGQAFNPLLTALVMALLLCSGIVAAFMLFDEFIIQLLFGDKYSGSASLLGLYALSFTPFAIVYILEHVLIAKGRVMFAYIMILIAPIQLAAILLYDGLDARTLIYFMSAGGCAMLAVGGLVVVIGRKDLDETPTL